MTSGIDFRHALHAAAELSGAEKNSAEIIRNDLSQHTQLKISGIGGYGILASSGASGGLLLRADIDALPISEAHLALTYGSTQEGVSHKCGHDGHATSLRCAAIEAQALEAPRAIHFLFQASEENGKGAPAVIHDRLFQEASPEVAFGMHNIPGKPLGMVLVKPGNITQAVVTLILKFHGISAHASSPELGNSPIPALLQVLDFSTSLVQQKSGTTSALITPTFIQIGSESNGTAPADGQLNLTIRSHETALLDSLCQEIRAEQARICNKFHLEFSVLEEDRFEACVNDPKAVDLLVDAASRAGLVLQIMDEAFAFGEDFGSYSSLLPSCFFGLGAGIDHAPLHHPDYDFPDELIDPAVNLWMCLIDPTLSYTNE